MAAFNKLNLKNLSWVTSIKAAGLLVTEVTLASAESEMQKYFRRHTAPCSCVLPGIYSYCQRPRRLHVFPVRQAHPNIWSKGQQRHWTTLKHSAGTHTQCYQCYSTHDIEGQNEALASCQSNKSSLESLKPLRTVSRSDITCICMKTTIPTVFSWLQTISHDYKGAVFINSNMFSPIQPIYLAKSYKKH